MSWYGLFHFLFKMHYKFYYRVEIIDAYHVPKDGPVILCCNHTSNWDPPLLGVSCPRKIRYMAKEELFKIPVVGFLLRQFGTYPVQRGSGDRAAIRKTLELLKENQVIGIFPEGTRSKTGELGPGKPGAAMFALKSDAAVIPVAIVGSYKRLFGTIKIRFGQPIELESYRQQKITSKQMEEVTQIIMDHIGRLIRQERSVS
ncbi:1-acyl-sn-glycerol-3-phosphate acyltransferase [Fodinisporobacter ferrooxydans]|uniref:1-acyl-sn-glycerol-3-phosphate acyltransferase n=1 Tax=Fodinisporobacter ferrooxydans TaxID=2901836 RepID=A0ABY4CJW4_9BACL|nr:1-acyl-sn-glycerol-3-phosphate acyltransferase [Alicyclobacillaceae bacterium MYW30-H2]